MSCHMPVSMQSSVVNDLLTTTIRETNRELHAGRTMTKTMSSLIRQDVEINPLWKMRVLTKGRCFWSKRQDQRNYPLFTV